MLTGVEDHHLQVNVVVAMGEAVVAAAVVVAAMVFHAIRIFEVFLLLKSAAYVFVFYFKYM